MNDNKLRKVVNDALTCCDTKYDCIERVKFREVFTLKKIASVLDERDELRRQVDMAIDDKLEVCKEVDALRSKLDAANDRIEEIFRREGKLQHLLHETLGFLSGMDGNQLKERITEHLKEIRGKE